MQNDNRFAFQLPLTQEIVDGIKQRQGKLLVSPTGTGKTVIIGRSLQECQNGGLLISDSKAYTIIILAPKATLIQEKRWAKKLGIKQCLVTSYSAMRSSLGELFIEWVTRMKSGEPTLVPVWIDEYKPDIIICQECQMVKNEASLAAQVVSAAIEQGILVMYSSATPFAKICEAKTVLKGLRLTDDYGWPGLSRSLCAYGKSPTDRSPQSAENLNNYLMQHRVIVRPGRIHFPHKLIITNELHTPDATQKRIIDEAYAKYLEEMAKQGRTWTPQGVGAIWAALTAMRQASELCRVRLTAGRLIKEMEQSRQPIIASNYRATVDAIKNILLNEMSFDESRLAFVVGGQDNHKRQHEVDMFNKGEKLAMLLMLKAGGTGLDLPHVNGNGSYPRSIILNPTWSPFECLQAAGRTQRIISDSDTHLSIHWFRDTVEEKVAAVMDQGVKSLNTFLTRANSLIDVLNAPVEQTRNEYARKQNEELLIEQLINDAIETDEEGNVMAFPVETLEQNNNN